MFFGKISIAIQMEKENYGEITGLILHQLLYMNLLFELSLLVKNQLVSTISICKKIHTFYIVMYFITN